MGNGVGWLFCMAASGVSSAGGFCRLACLHGGASAQMNMGLHKTVLTRIAANGGNIPPDILD